MSLEVGSESKRHRLFLTCFLCSSAVVEDVSEPSMFRSAAPPAALLFTATLSHHDRALAFWNLRANTGFLLYLACVVVLSQSNRKVTNHFPSAALQVCATTPDFQLQYCPTEISSLLDRRQLHRTFQRTCSPHGLLLTANQLCLLEFAFLHPPSFPFFSLSLR